MKKKETSRYLLAIAVVIMAAGLLMESQAVGDGIRRGLHMCASVLIPSLFPFMVLSGFLSLSEASAALSRPVGWISERLFKLPRELGALVLLSFVGGYPVGARMISSLYGQRRIDQSTAERMLCLCVNAGPSFLISAVGGGMLQSTAAGLVLFIGQIIAGVAVGSIVSRKASVMRQSSKHSYYEPVPAFVMAVTGACSAMLNMCAFAIAFAGITSLLNKWNATNFLAGAFGIGPLTAEALLGGFLEVTGGCIAASAIGGTAGIALLSAMVSFAGLSVHFQVMAMFRGTPVRFRKLLLSRLPHMVISTAVTVPLYLRFCRAQTAWISTQPPVMQARGGTWVLSACLIAMCTFFLLSENQKQGRTQVKIKAARRENQTPNREK